MSRPIIYLPMEPYLKEWFINDCGGDVPVTLRKGSAESDIVVIFASVPPVNDRNEHSPDDLPIYIPPSKMNDDTQHTFLSRKAKAALHACIRLRCRQQLWKDMCKLTDVESDAYGHQTQDLIYAWMSAHGIDDSETNYLALQKIYQRQRDVYRKKMTRKREKKNF